jgi:PAS domain S-box-containing protein
MPAELRDARSGIEQVRRGLETVLEDVRELSRGLHPALLSQGGLRAGLRALARASPIPVELDVQVEDRPPESIEIAAYYVVSEALANAAKHGRASGISVHVDTSDAVLRATIHDDGIGGADASRGSGLTGLVDRVEALGGQFALASPRGGGTRISIELPLRAESPGDLAQLRGSDGVMGGESFALQSNLLDVGDAGTLLAAVAAVADALYVVDAEGRIRFLNPMALRILGYEDPRQLVGRPSHDTIHYLRRDGTPFPAAECPLLRPRLTGETVRVEEDWFVRRDRSLVRVAYSSAAVPLPDGRGAVVSFREITERQPSKDGAR